MKKLFNILFATAALAMAILFLVRPDLTFREPKTASEVVPAKSPTPESEPVDNLAQIGLDAGLSLEAAREIANLVEYVEAVSNADEFDEATFNTMLADHVESMVTSARSERDRDPAALPNAMLMPPALSAGELASRRYENKWHQLITDMEVVDERAVRGIITEWEQFNLEVSSQFATGEISTQDYNQTVLTIEDLQASLRPYLSSNQLVDIAVNEELFWEDNRVRRNERRREHALAGYTTGIINAAAENDMYAVLQHVEAGADVNISSTDGRWTPLREAVALGNVEMVEFLIASGADINWVSSNGRSVLTEAATNGNWEMVRLLVSEGAALEGMEFTPLQSATMFNHTEVVRELLDLGVDVTGKAGSSALAWATTNGNQEMEQMLRNSGASRVAWLVE